MSDMACNQMATSNICLSTGNKSNSSAGIGVAALRQDKPLRRLSATLNREIRRVAYGHRQRGRLAGRSVGQVEHRGEWQFEPQLAEQTALREGTAQVMRPQNSGWPVCRLSVMRRQVVARLAHERLAGCHGAIGPHAGAPAA